MSARNLTKLLGRARPTLVALGISLAVVGSVPHAALAQSGKPDRSSPIGGKWQANTQSDTASPVAGITLEANQTAALKKISDYFNGFTDMKGRFLQTNSEKKRLRGKFFVKRPGRLRFEYSPPSKQLIVSDGTQLAIQDLDINTDDRIPLDQTPFRLLLRKDVDLLRDADILEVQEAEDLIVVTLQDKSPDAPGRIRLFFSKAPELDLKEWVTTDAQGLDTRVELSDLVKSETIDAGMFRITSPTLKKYQ